MRAQTRRRTNWIKTGRSEYYNGLMRVEVYRGASAWYARNPRTNEINGPHTTMRAAKIAAYELIA